MHDRGSLGTLERVTDPCMFRIHPSRLFATACLRFGRQEVVPVYACVFGSTMRGQMRPDSDIDIFVVRSGGAL